MHYLILAVILSPYALLALASLRTYLREQSERRAWMARTGQPWPDCLNHAPQHTYRYYEK